MDNTLADYVGYAEECGLKPSDAKHVRGFFRNLKPLPGAVEAYKKLSKYFDLYILSTAPWKNPSSLSEKIEWIWEWLPEAHKNVIFSHHKNLNIGDYLIDDSMTNGAAEFPGEHIQIHSEKFPDWQSVVDYIFDKENINYF